MSHFFGNDNDTIAAAWHAEPRTRGTWNILSTCLITMFLCIWTAVHLSIPDERKHAQTWRKCSALVVGLLAPELVAWNAWEQRKSVKRLTENVRNLKKRTSQNGQGLAADNAKGRSRRKVQDLWRTVKVRLLLEPGQLENEDLDRWPPDVPRDLLSAWTDSHSWYALMGGFALDTTSAGKPFLPGGRQLLTLTAEGVLLICEHLPRLLPRITEEMIKNKGRSDSLSKVITCWQATWFCVQCVSRLAQGLPICLLELNVFGHAVCALIIYAIWWNKPKDVEEPTRLGGEESNSIAALMSTFDGEGVALPYIKFFNWIPSDPKAGSEIHCPILPVEVYPVKALVYPNCLDIDGNFWSLSQYGEVPEKARDNYERYFEKHLPSTISIDRLTTARLAQIQHRDFMLALSKDLINSDQRNRYVLEAAASNRLVGLGTLEAELHHVARFKWSPWYLLAMALGTSLYGGLHVVAWDAGFPSSTERLLWRISSLTVASSGVGLICVFGVYCWTRASVKTAKDAEGIRFLSRLWHGGFAKGSRSPTRSPTRSPIPSLQTHLRDLERGRRLAAIKNYIVGVAILCPLMWYTLCRGYLVVESFISVARLSEADLKLPTWSQYVPHVT